MYHKFSQELSMGVQIPTVDMRWNCKKYYNFVHGDYLLHCWQKSITRPATPRGVLEIASQTLCR
jgi:hypothetical protein